MRSVTPVRYLLGEFLSIGPVSFMASDSIFIVLFSSYSLSRYALEAFLATICFVCRSANWPARTMAFSAAFYAPVSESAPLVSSQY